MRRGDLDLFGLIPSAPSPLPYLLAFLGLWYCFMGEPALDDFGLVLPCVEKPFERFGRKKDCYVLLSSCGSICVRRKGISDARFMVCLTSFTTLNLLPGSRSKMNGVS